MTENDSLGFLRVFLVAESQLGAVGGEFRHPWCLPGNSQGPKPLALNDGFAELELVDSLNSGESAVARVRPLRPELWSQIKPTDQLGLFVGVTQRGTAVVLERVGRSDAEGYLSDRMVPAGPLELRVLRAGLERRVLDATRLPTIATHYLMMNVPSASLALLAGLDVGQEVDPADARELLLDVFGELGQPIDDRRQVELLAMLLAKLQIQALMAPRQTCHRFNQLVVETGYEWPLPQIGELYGLDDEWDGGWGRSPAELSEATAALCTELLRTIEPSLGVLDSAAVIRLSELVS